MGATLERNVKPEFDALYGEGAFGRVYAIKTSEPGCPDYAWSMKVARGRFERSILWDK